MSAVVPAPAIGTLVREDWQLNTSQQLTAVMGCRLMICDGDIGFAAPA
ncbi:MAG: hypothetical protein ACPGLY_24680 [Rubripirellula sp.]